MRHIGEKMILLLCIAVFGIAAVKLIDIGKEYYDGQKEYKELKAYIKEVPVCQPEKMTGDEPEKETGKEIDFEGPGYRFQGLGWIILWYREKITSITCITLFKKKTIRQEVSFWIIETMMILQIGA